MNQWKTGRHAERLAAAYLRTRGYRIWKSNWRSGKKELDLVVCNPPFHEGQAIGDHIAWRMFKQSYDRLQPDGQLWVVGNKHLQYHAKLKRLFGNSRQIHSDNKFVVYAATKQPSQQD